MTTRGGNGGTNPLSGIRGPPASPPSGGRVGGPEPAPGVRGTGGGEGVFPHQALEVERQRLPPPPAEQSVVKLTEGDGARGGRGGEQRQGAHGEPAPAAPPTAGAVQPPTEPREGQTAPRSAPCV